MYNHKKLYSQNFLSSSKVASKFLSSSDISFEKFSTILEIGPGKGVLTKEILKRIQKKSKFLGVEIDTKLTKLLNQEFKNSQNVSFVNEDFLKFKLPNKEFIVVSNPPFNCASGILTKLLDPRKKMEEALLVAQKEAALMFMGYPVTTLKSMRTYPYWDIEVCHMFKPSDFDPQPSVVIVGLKISRKQQPLIPTRAYADYTRFLKMIARDRVGEGVWKRLFTRNQRRNLIESSALVRNRGISAQNHSSYIDAYKVYSKHRKMLVTEDGS